MRFAKISAIARVDRSRYRSSDNARLQGRAFFGNRRIVWASTLNFLGLRASARPFSSKNKRPRTPDEIAQVEKIEDLHRLWTDLFRVNINLNPAGHVVKMNKVALAHSRCSDAPAARNVFAVLEIWRGASQSHH